MGDIILNDMFKRWGVILLNGGICSIESDVQ